jgi:hypothetical protein
MSHLPRPIVALTPNRADDVTGIASPRRMRWRPDKWALLPGGSLEVEVQEAVGPPPTGDPTDQPNDPPS